LKKEHIVELAKMDIAEKWLAVKALSSDLQQA
jgi:hypothetical protein